MNEIDRKMAIITGARPGIGAAFGLCEVGGAAYRRLLKEALELGVSPSP